MAENQQEKLFCMNGNALREGDLVMVLLEKPVLTGFVTKIETSLLGKEPHGVITVTGTIRMQFDPRKPQIMRQTAKLVDPRSEQLVNALADAANKAGLRPSLPSDADLDAVAKEKEAGEKTTGPSLVITDKEA